MHRRLLVGSFASLLLAVCGAASAQNAFTARPMNVRAGPNRDYPLVAQLPPGAPLDVNGCLSDWSWCDVSFDGNRGWIYSGGLSFVYEGERVPLYSYAPQLGLPIITFSLMTYWDHYYRGRPWYRDRDSWDHRRMPPHMPPAGRPHPGPLPPPRRRPQMPQGRPEMQHGRPEASHGRPGFGGGAAPRREERAPAPPSGRPMQRQEHAPAPPPRGGQARHNPGRDEHGNGDRHPGPPL
jgi:uncharacterized protein YraI